MAHFVDGGYQFKLSHCTQNMMGEWWRNDVSDSGMFASGERRPQANVNDSTVDQNVTERSQNHPATTCPNSLHHLLNNEAFRSHLHSHVAFKMDLLLELAKKIMMIHSKYCLFLNLDRRLVWIGDAESKGSEPTSLTNFRIFFLDYSRTAPYSKRRCFSPQRYIINSPKMTYYCLKEMDHVSVTDDIYALGCLFLEICADVDLSQMYPTKNMRKQWHSNAQLDNSLMQALEQNGNPPELIALILKMMGKNQFSQSSGAAYKSMLRVLRALKLIRRMHVDKALHRIPSALLQKDDLPLDHIISIPYRFFGREQEIDALCKMMDAAQEELANGNHHKSSLSSTRNTSHLFLITGAPGSGKSALVRACALVKRCHIIFANSTFHCEEHDSEGFPFAAIHRLMESLVSHPDSTLSQEDLPVLDRNRLDTYKSTPYATEFVKQYVDAVLDFFHLFCTSPKRLVLFVDQLENMDHESVKLLLNMLLSNDLSFLLVATCNSANIAQESPKRTNGVESNNRLGAREFLSKLTELRFPTTAKELQPLSEENITDLISECTALPRTRAMDALHEFVLEESMGNPLAAHEIILLMKQRRLLRFSKTTFRWEHAEQKNGKAKHNAMHTASVCVKESLSKSAPLLRFILSTAANIGPEFSLHEFHNVYNMKPTVYHTRADLHQAVREGFLTEYALKGHQFNYCFNHDTYFRCCLTIFSASQRELLQKRLLEALDSDKNIGPGHLSKEMDVPIVLSGKMTPATQQEENQPMQIANIECGQPSVESHNNFASIPSHETLSKEPHPIDSPQKAHSPAALPIAPDSPSMLLNTSVQSMTLGTPQKPLPPSSPDHNLVHVSSPPPKEERYSRKKHLSIEVAADSSSLYSRALKNAASEDNSFTRSLSPSVEDEDHMKLNILFASEESLTGTPSTARSRRAIVTPPHPASPIAEDRKYDRKRVLSVDLDSNSLEENLRLSDEDDDSSSESSVDSNFTQSWGSQIVEESPKKRSLFSSPLNFVRNRSHSIAVPLKNPTKPKKTAEQEAEHGDMISIVVSDAAGKEVKRKPRSNSVFVHAPPAATQRQTDTVGRKRSNSGIVASSPFFPSPTEHVASVPSSPKIKITPNGALSTSTQSSPANSPRVDRKSPPPSRDGIPSLRASPRDDSTQIHSTPPQQNPRTNSLPRFGHSSDWNNQSVDTLDSVYEQKARTLPSTLLYQLGKKSIECESCVLHCTLLSIPSSYEIDPEQSFGYVNDFLNTVCPAIENNYGYIDRFQTSSVYGVFPPYKFDVTISSVNSAIEMMYNVRDLCIHSQIPMQIGVSIHMGNIKLGTIGYSSRVQASALGSPIEFSAVLNQLNKRLKSPIIITDQVYNVVIQLSDALDQVSFRQLGRFVIGQTGQGGAQDAPITLFELYDTDWNIPFPVHNTHDTSNSHMPSEVCSHHRFTQIYEDLFARRCFGACLQRVREEICNYPHDHLLRMLKEACKLYDTLELPTAWRGEIRIDHNGNVLPVGRPKVIVLDSPKKEEPISAPLTPSGVFSPQKRTQGQQVDLLSTPNHQEEPHEKNHLNIAHPRGGFYKMDHNVSTGSLFSLSSNMSDTNTLRQRRYKNEFRKVKQLLVEERTSREREHQEYVAHLEQMRAINKGCFPWLMHRFFHKRRSRRKIYGVSASLSKLEGGKSG